ncbi:MAG: hypothetical protein EPN85_00710 [Bacteroidetes bacterium]|nr:MAG: hypothetical protein EPN85_00710 [Bacteroidota bacterium]
MIYSQLKKYPFSPEQLCKLESEIEKAGDFEKLMFKKKALKKEDGTMVVAVYEDIEKYKELFLTEEYESLRSIYDTQVPWSFWGALYESLIKMKEAE